MPGRRNPIARRVDALVAGRGRAVLAVLVAVLTACLAMLWSYHIKMRCGGEPFNDLGRSANFPGGDSGRLIPCYSDIFQLWLGRGVNAHLFPYVHGGMTPDGSLVGGSVEYPVLSGLLMYFGAIGAHNDTEFFTQSALLLAPFGIIVAALLAVLARWRALLWSATPPLVLYAFHNWELPVVATTVGAIAVMAWGAGPRRGSRRPRLSLRTAAVAASILLAVGMSLKLYPGLFVLPLAIHVWWPGRDGRADPDWVGAGRVVGAAVATTLVIQVPFMLAGFDGWRAALTYQSDRFADATTNSLWYWGLRFVFGGITPTYNAIVSVASPILILCAFAVSLALGRRRAADCGEFPWIGVAASMLAGFMLFHKVHSPQYTLWILPFFVLLNIRWSLIAIYLASDLVLDVAVFRYLGFVRSGWPAEVSTTAVGASSLIHAVLHAVLVVAFVRAELRLPLAGMLDRSEHHAVDESHTIHHGRLRSGVHGSEGGDR